MIQKDGQGRVIHFVWTIIIFINHSHCTFNHYSLDKSTITSAALSASLLKPLPSLTRSSLCSSSSAEPSPPSRPSPNHLPLSDHSPFARYHASHGDMGCTPWPADMVSSKQRRPVCRILSFGEDPPVEEGTQRRIPSNVPVPRLAPAIALPTSSAATAQSAAAPAAIAATETPHHLEEDTSPVLHKPANRSKRRRVVVSTDSSEKTHKRRGDDKSAVDVASSSSLSPAPPSPPVLLPESDSPSNLYRFVASVRPHRAIS